MAAQATFALDRSQLDASGRVVRGEWTASWLDQVEGFLDQIARETGRAPVQRGRVVAVRQTDRNRLFSAFKTSLYHSRYYDMLNGDRFFNSLLPDHNTYEPFRGETILFLYLYVGKNVYDGLSMFTYGRTARIIGGSRHSVPWGVEVAPDIANREAFVQRHMQSLSRLAHLDGLGDARSDAESAELEALRCELPVCYCMAPFLLEFSEEALMTKVFKQRLWEGQNAKRDTGIVAADMWECCLALDRPKFEAFYDYNGPHTVFWEDSMRLLRDGGAGFAEFDAVLNGVARELEEQSGNKPVSAYDVLMGYFGRMSR